MKREPPSNAACPPVAHSPVVRFLSTSVNPDPWGVIEGMSLVV
jgi:hypothetical protein